MKNTLSTFGFSFFLFGLTLAWAQTPAATSAKTTTETPKSRTSPSKNTSKQPKRTTQRKERSRAIRYTVDNSKVLGSLPKANIARALRTHWAQVRSCYYDGLRKNPKLAGTVNIRLVLNSTGQVKAAKIASTTLKNKRVESCLMRKISHWRFSTPRNCGVAIATLPFLLLPKYHKKKSP